MAVLLAAARVMSALVWRGEGYTQNGGEIYHLYLRAHSKAVKCFNAFTKLSGKAFLYWEVVRWGGVRWSETRVKTRSGEEIRC
jgi:hypothetical protein